ncbi:HNH endonuclease [Niallia sp. Krafla_26]|uniref:HNH endonuclease n=1 Tax=Niallia sp. Krafla_26 TaxID=3064703 RepID=UPI003D17CB3A
MNKKPLKPCSKIGCQNLTTSRYCDQHQTEFRNQNRFYDLNLRNKKSDSFYHSAAWKKARDLVKIRDNGLCQECIRNKRIAVGTEVDHIIPIKQDWNKRLELGNLQLLCKACHNKKTGVERAGEA